MVKPMGMGYRIIEFGDSDIHLPENEKIVNNIVSTAKRIRGEIISGSTDIEFILNEIIGLFFTRNDSDLLDAFNESILQKEFFTFSEKSKVLNYLLKKHPEKFHLTSDEDRNEIIRAIREVIEYRNKFAHEEIVVNFQKKEAFIFDKKGNNLLSPASVKKFYNNVGYLTMVHLALYSNFMIEIGKNSQNQS